MGASKEDSMSVRERIDLVLGHEVAVSLSLLQNPEEIVDDEALSASGGKGGGGRGSSIVPTSSSSKSSVGGGVGLNNNGASASPSGNQNPKRGLSNFQSPAGTAATTPTPGGGGGTGKEGPDGSSSSWGDGAGRGLLTLDRLLNSGDDGVNLKRLILAQLQVITTLNIRLSMAESKSGTVAKERDQLQEALKSESLERISLVSKNEALEEQRKNAESTIKEKEEKIRELESRLAAATAPKPMAHQGTLMTPPPPPPIPPEVQNQGDMIPRKRRKLNPGEGDLLATSSNTIQSYHAKSTMPNRRSDSPPQLSLAVTPKSATQKPSLRESGTTGHAAFLLGDRVEDDMSEYPPDEFQDELDRINYLSQRSRGEGSSGSIMPSSKRLLPSGSSAFSRPQPRSSDGQLARFMHPEIKKNLMTSMQQFRQSLQHPTSVTSNSLAPKNISGTDTSNALLPREPPQLSSSRTNNFLNMSRPVARRPQLSSTYQSSQGAPSSEETSQQHSRSIDLSTSENAKITEDTTANPVIPTVVKKRGPGRPPGFRPKKRVPVVTPLTPTSLGITDTRLSNGVLEDLQSKSEPPPPRFSKRGRLLKPNRARYSPDPDNSTHSSSREKFMTTKKSYYVSEPFVPEGYGGSLDGTIGSDTLLGTDADSLSRQGIEEDEPTCPAARPTDKESGEGDGSTAFVEVPRWRILTYDEIFPPNQPGDERKTPDDMSEEAFIKRHQKPEAQEKQRKRWDLQMLREESYKERMQRKQAERERQKELRRQQRKRKGRAGATEEEVVNPSVEDIKAINVSQELPVGAFGQTLPINEKVDFHFSSGCASSPLPSPKPVVTVNLDNANEDTNVICSTKVRDSDSCTTTSAVVKVNKEVVDRKESGPGVTEVIAVEDRPSPTPPPLPSSSSPTSLSSLSLPSLPSPTEPQAASPPPPVIFCVRDSEKSKDVYEYTEDDDNLLAPSLTILDRSKIISDRKKGRESPLPFPPTKSASSNIDDDNGSDRTSSQIISRSHKVQPSVTIPLAIPTIKSRNPSGGCASQPNFPNQSDNLPMMSCPDSSTNTEQSSTALDSPSKSASIKFLIPNNPLARPRPSIISSVSIPSTDSSNVRIGDDEQSSKDKNLSS